MSATVTPTSPSRRFAAAKRHVVGFLVQSYDGYPHHAVALDDDGTWIFACSKEEVRRGYSGEVRPPADWCYHDAESACGHPTCAALLTAMEPRSDCYRCGATFVPDPEWPAASTVPAGEKCPNCWTRRVCRCDHDGC